MLECVINISEGRRSVVLDELVEICGPQLLDLHIDPDHNRSVFTLAGPGPADAIPAAVDLARAVNTRIDLRNHQGVHPRFGALDVVPFCALAEASEIAVDAAHAFGRWAAVELELPVFFYDDADPEHRSLPTLRATAFTEREPDDGPSTANPRLGAVAVGARQPLVAVNFSLASFDVDAARTIARTLRERDGGLPGVRALGFALAAKSCAQVSLNLVDLKRTGLEAATIAVEQAAAAMNQAVNKLELVGLMPEAEFACLSPEFVARHSLSADDTVEGRLKSRT